MGAATALNFACLLHQGLVSALETVPLPPLAIHQGVANEHLAGQLTGRRPLARGRQLLEMTRLKRPRRQRILRRRHQASRQRLQRPRARSVRARGGHGLVDDEVTQAPQQHLAVRCQRQPVEGHALADHRRALRDRPERLRIRALEQAARRRLHPLRADAGHRSGEQARGLHELRGHHPGGVAAHARARPDRKVRAARALVVALRLVPRPQVGQQAHQQRAVHLVRVHGSRPLPVGQDRAHGRVLRAAELGGLHDVARRRLAHRPHADSQRAGHLAQLADDVAPLAPPQVVKKLRAAQAPERRARQVACLHRQVAPQVQVGDEVRMRVRQARVRGVGRALVLGRALAHVLDRQRRHDDEHLRGAAQALGLEQHAPQARVDRQARQVPADAGEPVLGRVRGCVLGPTALRERADLHEEGHAVAHRAPIRGIQEREVLDRAQAQGRHLQNDAGQRRTQDLRLRETRARVVIGLREQADRHALRDAATSARALVRTRLADRLDRQALHLRLIGIAGNARQTRVDDVADARHRQRRLRDVRRQDHAAQAVRLEDAMLLGRRQPRVQRQDFDVPASCTLVVSRAPASSLQVIEEGRLRVADVALAGQEDQDVAVALRAQLVHRVADRGLHVDVLAHAVAQRRQLVVRVLQDQLHRAGLGDVGGLDGLDRLVRLRGRGLGRVRRGRRRPERTVADFDRVRAARHLDDRRGLDQATRAGRPLPRAEMARKTVRIDRRRRDDDLQVRARGQQARHVAQDEVDVQAAFVGLVDDERVVAAQHRIRLDLRQQDAVRHEFDEGRGAHLVRETHLVADHLAALAAHGLAQLVGDAIRDRARREPARLGVPDHAGDAAAQLHADLRQLRRLTRAGLARHDDHLVVSDGARDLTPALAHRQVREGDDGDCRRAFC